MKESFEEESAQSLVDGYLVGYLGLTLLPLWLVSF